MSAVPPATLRAALGQRQAALRRAQEAFEALRAAPAGAARVLQVRGLYEVVCAEATQLGAGSEARVYLARSTDRLCEWYAAKVVERPLSRRGDHELRVYMRARSRAAMHLVPFLCVDDVQGVTVIVMPLQVMSLRQRLALAAAVPEFALSLDEQLYLGRAVCQCVASLHAAGLVHGDVRLDNLLLDQHGAVVLADLGLSVVEADAAPTMSGAAGARFAPLDAAQQFSMPGTVYSVPPGRVDQPYEVVHALVTENAASARASFAADVFMCGLSVFLIFSGDGYPFASDDSSQQPAASTMAREYAILTRKPLLEHLVAYWPARVLLRRMLSHDVAQRPPASVAAAHPAFWAQEARESFVLIAYSMLVKGGAGRALSQRVRSAAAVDPAIAQHLRTWHTRCDSRAFSVIRVTVPPNTVEEAVQFARHFLQHIDDEHDQHMLDRLASATPSRRAHAYVFESEALYWLLPFLWEMLAPQLGISSFLPFGQLSTSAAAPWSVPPPAQQQQQQQQQQQVAAIAPSSEVLSASAVMSLVKGADSRSGAPAAAPAAAAVPETLTMAQLIARAKPASAAATGGGRMTAVTAARAIVAAAPPAAGEAKKSRGWYTVAQPASGARAGSNSAAANESTPASAAQLWGRGILSADGAVFSAEHLHQLFQPGPAPPSRSNGSNDSNSGGSGGSGGRSTEPAAAAAASAAATAITAAAAAGAAPRKTPPSPAEEVAELVRSGDVTAVRRVPAAQLRARLAGGRTMLHVAASESRSPVMVKLLLELEPGDAAVAAGADGCTPLHEAAAGALEPAVLEALLRHGPQSALSAHNRAGLTPLLWALERCPDHAVVQHVTLLVAAGASLYDCDASGRNAKKRAQSHPQHASALLRVMADTVREADGWSDAQLESFQEAVLNGHVHRLNSFPDALLYVRDKGGATPLHWAASGRSAQVVRYLLNRGASVSARDGRGQTPLHLAMNHAVEPVVGTLLKDGADVLATDHDGNTPLHTLLTNDPLFQPHLVETAQMLVTHGAPLDLPNRAGLTPVALARSHRDAAQLAPFIKLQTAHVFSDHLQRL